MKENPYYNSRGGSRAWRQLRDLVLRQEPLCRVRLEGCTVLSTTVNHIVPKALAPELVMVRSNCQGACKPCNLKLGKKSRAQVARKSVGSSRQQPARALAFFE